MTLKTIKDAAAQRRAKISSKDDQEMDLGIHREQVQTEMGPAFLGMGRCERDPVRGYARVVVECIVEKTEENTTDFDKAEISEMCNTYPLKVMVPHYASNNNSKWIYPITFGGGLVGGDSTEMNIHVKTGCCAVLTGQESTKIYHCLDHMQTTQALTCQVDDHALLCILSDPVVCYKDSIFLQTQVIHMSSSSNLVYLDWMIGGRVALDELWQFKRYQNRTEVYIDDKLAYKDNYLLSDNGVVPIAHAMRHFQVQGTCIILGRKLKPVSDNLYKQIGRTKQLGEKQDTDLVCSISHLKYKAGLAEIQGVYIRFLASTSSKAYQGCISHVIRNLEPIIGGNPFEGKYR